MRVHLVTGASTGIGRACALALRARGATVYGSVRRQEDADALSADDIRPLLFDVTDEEAVIDGVAALLDEAGRLDGLVNNAGIATGGPVEALETAELQRVLDVNVVGVHRVTRAALPSLIDSHGRIAMLSSISGRVGLPFFAAYAASKFALEGYSDALRREMAPFDVRVSLIEPGQVATPIWDKSVPGVADLEALPTRYHALGYRLRDQALEGATAGIAPEEVAAAVVDALEGTRPRARYAMPTSDRLAGRLAPALPERLVDRVIRGRIG